MKTVWKIERYERTGDTTWSATPDVLTTLYAPYDIIVRDKLGDGKDTFSWNMVNFSNELDDYFNVNDKVTISRAVDTSTLDSDDIVMTGIITQLPYGIDGSKVVQKVSGTNYTETLMNAISFVGAANLPIDQFLTQALASVANYNDAFKVTWNSSNPSVTSGGAAFPDVTERWYNKSITKALEKYSSGQYTGDGNYYYFVDKNNTLVWRREVGDPQYEFNSSTNEDYTMMNISKDTKDVINFVICKSSDFTPKGRVLTVRVDDGVSRAKHGFKPYIMVSKASYATNLYALDGVDNRTPTSFPFDTAWVASVTRASNPTMTPGSPVTIASLNEYETAITEEVKFSMKKDAKAFKDLRKNGKLQVEVVFPNGKATGAKIPWALGGVVNVTIPQIDKTAKPMRVHERELRTDEERYVLIEDEGTV